MKSVQAIGLAVALIGFGFMACGVTVGGARGVIVGLVVYVAALIAAWLIKE